MEVDTDAQDDPARVSPDATLLEEHEGTPESAPQGAPEGASPEGAFSEAAAAAAALEDEEEESVLTTSSIVAEATAMDPPLTPDELGALIAAAAGPEGSADSDDAEVAAAASAAVPPPGAVAAVERLQTHPFDADAWGLLIAESKTAGWKRREILAAAARQFPTSGKIWVDVIAHALSLGDEVGADSLWVRAMRLTGFASLDLWELKLRRALERYRAAAATREAAAASGRAASGDEMERARRARDGVCDEFDACIARVGHDFLAGRLWLAYAGFVKGWPSGPAATSQERCVGTCVCESGEEGEGGVKEHRVSESTSVQRADLQSLSEAGALLSLPLSPVR